MTKTYVTLLLLLVVGCVTVADTGRKRLAPIPDGYMDSLGANSYLEMKATEKISTDKIKAANITEIGKRIALASGANFAWEFTLFENGAVNAFCLPGGKVGVYTGILPVARTNAGLAAIIGHEVAHAIARHGGERLSQQILVSGAMLTVDQMLKEPKQKQLVLGILGIGTQLGFILPYSRLHESEADQMGTIYMAKAGYDPREAVAVWQRMAADSRGKVPEFLSTHPDSSRRAQELNQTLTKALNAYNQSVKIPTIPL